jgi:glycosyltransferase involved in cell wall biosynthesis
MKQIITVVVPTYNEEKNILNIYKRVNDVFSITLADKYSYEIQFVDNCSTDNTRKLICNLCKSDKRVKAIFNAKNFGFVRSQFYGLSQAEGDAAILMCADMQDPPEVIPRFIEEWEKGFLVVVGIKNKSKENPILYLGRNIYYKLIKKMSEIDHITQYDGFGLYDKSFINVLRKLDDNLPYLRGIVAELGPKRKEIEYEQERRREGKSHFKFMSLYDLAMLGITSYTKVVMHICTLVGGIVAGISFLVAIYAFIMKLLFWNSYPFSTAAIQIGVFMLGALNIFFVGFIGEYIVNMNTRIMHHPLVIEERRINFKGNTYE